MPANMLVEGKSAARLAPAPKPWEAPEESRRLQPPMAVSDPQIGFKTREGYDSGLPIIACPFAFLTT